MSRVQLSMTIDDAQHLHTALDALVAVTEKHANLFGEHDDAISSAEWTMMRLRKLIRAANKRNSAA